MTFLAHSKCFNREEHVGEDLLCSASELMCEDTFWFFNSYLSPKCVSGVAQRCAGWAGSNQRAAGWEVKVDRFWRSMLNFKSVLVEMEIILPLLYKIILKIKIKRNPNGHFWNFIGKKWDWLLDFGAAEETSFSFCHRPEVWALI